MSCKGCGDQIEYQQVDPAPPEHYWHQLGAKGFWSIVKPVGVEVTNIVENPSAEFDLTNWDGDEGATITRKAAAAMHGAQGIEVTVASSGGRVLYVLTDTVQINRAYCGCITIRGETGTAEFDLLWPGAPQTEPTKIRLTGYPQRVCYSLQPIPAFPLLEDVLARVIFDTPGVYHVDGLMLVEGEPNAMSVGCLTEYFDGDSPGASWDGTPHASTSTMSRFSRAYGEQVDLNEVGFNIISADGFGLAPYNNIVTSFARGNGAHLQRQQLSSRTLSLVGQMQGGPRGMHRTRKSLIDAINYRFKGQCVQELLLRYQLFDDCGCEMSQVVQIPAVYAAGLEGSWSQLESERAAIQFQAHRQVNWMSPFENAAALTPAGDDTPSETYTTTVTYTGDEDAWITIQIRGGDGGIQVASVQNLTTGAAVLFVQPDDPNDEFIAVNAGDYALVTTDPRALSLNYFPDGSRQMSRIRYPGSQLAAMRLIPGENEFEVVVPFHGEDSIVIIHWHDQYSSLDAIPMCDGCTGNYQQ